MFLFRQKQNKIYIDLSAEKFKLDNADVAKLQDMVCKKLN